MSQNWSSNDAVAIDLEDYNDTSILDDYLYITNDQKNNAVDWYFPIVDLYEINQWLLFENDISLNELRILEVCHTFKNKLLSEFQTEIFLQHPFIIQTFIRWLNENKEIDLILECFNLLVDKLTKRHYECSTGISENVESINSNFDCSNSQITIAVTNSDTTTSDEVSRWGIGRFCVSLMPTVLKHISCNSSGAFSLFMSGIKMLSLIDDNYNIKFYIELILSNDLIKTILLNDPLSSLKFLIISKEIFTLCSPNGEFKKIICNILKQPYWIHLYPELFHLLNEKIINEELLELKIIKMVENTYTLLTTCDLDIKQYANLFSISLPILWFHKKFHLIDKFIGDTCKHAKLTDTTNQYSNILLNLLSYKSENVVLHTYLTLNKMIKALINNFNLKSKHIDRLLKYLLCSNVLNEILCFGCVHSNKQISQLASEIMEQLLMSKNTITNDLWECLLSSLVSIFPVLFCYSNQSSTFGQTIFNLFDPDHANNFNISRLMLLQSMVLMLMSKDKQSRVEANNRITWLLQTTLDKSIDLPNNIFLIEFEDFDEKLDEPIGEYTESDLNGMVDLIVNECSSHQTIKCALYKISVMLEHSHLQQHFIHIGGINIILNLFKSSNLFVNERGLLIALLKLILCFTKKSKYSNKDNVLANNFEIQLQIISVLSDFYEIPLVKQYIFQIFVYCIFDEYLTHFGEIPNVVVDKIYPQIKIKKHCNPTNIHDNDVMLISNIKENKNCMDVLILTWHLKHFNTIDLFLENGFTTHVHNYAFDGVFYNIRTASVNWSVKKCLVNLGSVKSHSIALTILRDLKRYLELSLYTEKFEIDEKLLEKALKKFLVLPPIFLSDLQTLIVVLKLLNFAFKKRALINELNWVTDTLMKSRHMHHNIVNTFKNIEGSNQLCNSFFIELYEVYWLCLKNCSNFSTLNLTKLLFYQLSSSKTELVLLQVNLQCLTALTENPKNICKEVVQLYLSELISLKTILMTYSNEKSLQRSFLKILNHILHYTILIPNISDIWCIYDWETWTWSMIHSTDPIVRALVFQFSAGLAVIDIPVSHNLIQLALNYFCESNCVENCIVAEQATILCSNIFCNPKFKSLCHQYIIKMDFNAFVHIINMCSCYDFTKSEKKYYSVSPKLVTNLCCMLFNMITLTELNLRELDQSYQFVHTLTMCLKKHLTSVCIEKPSILEMCGRICSVLTLFVPVNNYNFENLLSSLNIIYEGLNTTLDHCTIMVWRSIFKFTVMIIKCRNYKTCVITNHLILVLLKSVTFRNNDLCIDALNMISVICPQLSIKFAHQICKVLIDTLYSEWHNKLKRKILLVALSNIFLEHVFTYETAKKNNFICFIISKFKIMQLELAKQSMQKSKILQNDYWEVIGFCCNIFYACTGAREDASMELPDLVHKLWPMVITNSKSDLLICTIKTLVSLTSNCSAACSAMTMTSNTLGVDSKIKSSSYSLFHEIISLFNDSNVHEDVLSITLQLILNCCQSQECRTIITKSKLLSNIVLKLDLKDKKHFIKIEQKCLNFLLVFTSFNEGQHILKVNYILDTLVDLLKSNYKSDSIAILRNLCFNTQNRMILLSSDIFLCGFKCVLENGNLTNQQYKDISLAVWALACNNQKARLQLRHWGIDKYFEKSSNILVCDNETQKVMECTHQVLKN